MEPNEKWTNNIVFYDGVCAFCNIMVQRVIKRDPKAIFRYASLQSSLGARALKEHQLPADYKDGIVVYIAATNTYYTQGEAAVQIFSRLPEAPWKKKLISIIPLFIINAVYKVIAKYRYKLAANAHCDVSLKTTSKYLFLD